MTWSRYDRPRRVMQAYRRSGDDDAGTLSIDEASKLLEGPGVGEAAGPPDLSGVELLGEIAAPPRSGIPRQLIPAEELGPGASRGATFGTRDEAGRAALDAINNWSRMLNREYRWLIYQDKDGRYRYTPPVYSGLTGVVKKKMTAPGAIVGFGHTHGDYSYGDGRRTDREHASLTADDFSSGGGDDDYGFMRKYKDRIEAFYLGTPSGEYYRWTKKDGRTRF